ncbi:MAG: hypothetical protein JWO75_6227 [Actinomycetia bacterium]|nr:hypothetical protein [Actinomycetes bacterium]
MTPKPAGGTGKLPSDAAGLFAGTGTHGSTYCGTTPRSAATSSALSRPAPITHRPTARATETSDGGRTSPRAERPQPDVQPGNGRPAGAPSRTGRAGLELALGAWRSRRPRRPFRIHRERIRPSWTRCHRGGRAGGRRSSAAVLAASPPMVHRTGLVPYHAAPGPNGLRERLGPDQERQAAAHPGHLPVTWRAMAVATPRSQIPGAGRGIRSPRPGSALKRGLLSMIAKSRTRSGCLLTFLYAPAPSACAVPSPCAAPSRSLMERMRSWATSMTSRDCLASPVAFLALTASPSMTMQ